MIIETIDDRSDGEPFEDDGVEIILPHESLERETDNSASPKPRSGLMKLTGLIGLGVLLGGALVASAAWYFQPEPFDDAELRAEIATLQSRLNTVQARPEPTPTDLSPLTRRLETTVTRLQALEARIQQLENTPDPAPIYADLVGRLEVLQEQGFEIPEDFVFPDMPEPVDLSEIEGRVDTIEQRLTALRAQRAAAVSSSMQEDIDETPVDLSNLGRFPGDRLREAADELSGEGLVQRIWSQHVRVRGEKTPRVLINDIESHLASSQPRAALASFEQLPEPMQDLARAWRAELESVIAASNAAQTALEPSNGDTP